MPEWPEQRRFSRYQIILPLLHKATPADLTVGVGWTRNLGQGGACVELAERLEPRMPRWGRLQTNRGPIEVEAQVAWAGESSAATGAVLHGLAFTRIAPAHLQTFAELIRSEGEIRQAGVRVPIDLSVTCQPKEQMGPSLRGQTADISRGGLSLRLPQRLAPSTMVNLILRTPHGPLTAEGKIVWTAPADREPPTGPIRHGVQFTRLGWSTSLSLGLVLAESP